MTGAVGIACVETAPVGVARAAGPSRHCSFVGQARQGKTLWTASDDINCPIARHILGCDLTGGGWRSAAAAFVESKLAKDSNAAVRLLQGFRALEPRRRVFVYFPAEEAPVPADIVVRFLKPEEAMRQLRAVVTATGERAEVHTAGSAAMCGDCTAGPLVTGRVAFSPGCPGSRREIPLAVDEVLLALPGKIERVLNG